LGGRRGRLISASDRELAIQLIKEAVQARAREFKACEELGISQRTLKRWKKSGLEDQRPYAKHPEPKSKLSEEEVQVILDITNEKEFQSLPPSQIVPILADRGVYLASESTFYRVLRKYGRQYHPGRSNKPVRKQLSTHVADGPNQIWMWDITWLPGPVKGMYYYLYLILDLYSCKVIAWEIWLEESAENASQLVRRAVLAENIGKKEQPLVLHSDNGSPMKGATLLETLYFLGIKPSRSRPRVSNDNPYAESIFRTCKYCPNYPLKGFGSLEEARSWTLTFVRWYNNDHRHSGLNFLTPAQRHNGEDQAIFEQRTKVYEDFKAAHPERWKGRKTRDWSLNKEVWLNPEHQVADSQTEANSL